MTTKYCFSAETKTVAFPKYWQKCVGSCHAKMGVRADWQQHLKFIHDELGIEYVRFHGLLDDDMYVIETAKQLFNILPNSIRTQSFYHIDCVFDFILRIGMKPFVELGFMPSVLASGRRTVFHYKGNITPPKNYDAWAALIHDLVQHLIERYGLDEIRRWYFEVWNEPDLFGFWAGSQKEYFKLYSYTSKAIKQVDSQLRVGGPATSNNRWIPEMIQFCEKNQVSLDFISTHQYPSDTGKGLGFIATAKNSLKILKESKGKSIHSFFSRLLDLRLQLQTAGRGVLKGITQKARQEAGKYPLFYTEWNANSSATLDLNDETYSSAFIVKNLVDLQGLAEIYSFWTFSDIFEEIFFFPEPFSGAFGMLNIHGIPKPSFWAFKFMHQLGLEKFDIPTTCESPTIEMITTKDKNGLQIICYNFQVPNDPIKAEDVNFEITDLSSIAKVTIQQINEDHGNPKKLWQQLGSPIHLKPDQVEQIRIASAVTETPIDYQFDRQKIHFQIHLSAFEVLLIKIYFA